MPFQPYCITERSPLTDAIRSAGFKNYGVEGFPGSIFNEIVFKSNQDFVLGSSSQVTAGDADIYYDSSVFRDINADPIVLSDFDRITVILTTLTESITFPAVQLNIKNHIELDMDGFNMEIQDVITGVLNIAGSGSVLTVSGQSNMLVVNHSVATVSFTGSGSLISNGTVI